LIYSGKKKKGRIKISPFKKNKENNLRMRELIFSLKIIIQLTKTK
jgi:hypothetical protein